MWLKSLGFRIVAILVFGMGGALTPLFAAYTAAQNSDIAPQQLDAAGQEGYREFSQADDHRAFAIAPGGAWAWVSGLPDPDVAESEAIRACAGYTEQSCMIFALDGQVVFDAGHWAGLWGPYAPGDDAAGRPVGTARGKQFPDLMLTEPGGAPLKLSDLRGRIVLLHFWGSWCAPCQVEFPELQALYDSLKNDGRIAFVLVQVREDIARSRRWAEQRGFAMPFHDSGVRSASDGLLATPDGRGIEDRILAPQFPGTYVLDKNGLVLFHHFGPLHSWGSYEPLFRHAMIHAPD